MKKILHLISSPMGAHSHSIRLGRAIVRANTIEEAVELAKANPIFKVGGTVEVREVLNFYH